MESARNLNASRCGCTTAASPGAGQEQRAGCQPQREAHRVACRVGSCPAVSHRFPSHTPLPPCSYSLPPESTAAVTNIWKDELTENQATFHGGRTTRSSQPHFSETAPCFLRLFPRVFSATWEISVQNQLMLQATENRSCL